MARTIIESLCEGEACICQILTQDETWMFWCEPEPKRRSTKWHYRGSLCPQKFQ